MTRQRWRRPKFIGRVFERDGHAAGLREHRQAFEGREGGVQLARIRRLTAMAHVLNEEAEGNSLGDIQRPLDFIHGIEASYALRIRN